MRTATVNAAMINWVILSPPFYLTRLVRPASYDSLSLDINPYVDAGFVSGLMSKLPCRFSQLIFLFYSSARFFIL